MKIATGDRWSASVLILVLLAAGLSACSSGGGGSAPAPAAKNSVQLTGTVAATGAAAALRAGAAAATATADTVWAIPIAKMQGANIDVVNFILRKTSTLDASGNFSFTLEKTISLADIIAKVPDLDITGMDASAVFDVDWMLVQMAGSTPVGMISLQGDATYDNLLSIPLSAFTPDTMNVGTVDSTSGVATLSVSTLASNVTMSAGSLEALSRTDDILGTIKDVIRNCDLTTNTCINGRQSFVFMGDYASITSLSTYDTATMYTGYQLYFDLNDYYDNSEFFAICPTSGAPTVEYTLTPPGPISLISVTYDTGNALSTGSTSTTSTGTRQDSSDEYRCFKDILYVSSDVTSTGNWHLQFITGDVAAQLTTDTPAGDWVLARNNGSGPVEIGKFEFSLANPVDANGNPIVFVPAIRFDVDAANYNAVQTLHVKWYQHNGTGYVEVTDATLLNSLLGGYEISLDDWDGVTGNTLLRRNQKWGIDFSTTTIDVRDLDGNGPYFYNELTQDRYNLAYFGISYQFGGQSFRFAWRPATP
ncbi:MAG: hypothetical protein OEW15_00990 [Nitrospirota bacterium]|nr:hypothetical protein [Nitrospirota bacterium]